MHRGLQSLALGAVLVLAASCGGGGATAASTASPPATATPSPSPSPSPSRSPVLFSAVPLTDMGPVTYLGLTGGLYGGGSNAVPAASAAQGVAMGNAVVPLDASGKPSGSGKIVLLSIGMSNATDEWCASTAPPCSSGTFTSQALADPSVNATTLVIANGAIGGADASTWTSSTSPNYDTVKNTMLPNWHVSEAQVEVVWLKDADAGPTVSLPAQNADAYVLEGYLGQILRALKVRYPNLRQVFLSSRTYGGYATTNLNPEPYAYESGFSVRGVILAQIAQMQSGTVDSTAGDLNWNTSAPWASWGAYLWANGPNPRSDGLVWLPSDVQSDGTHPSASGVQKVAGLLLRFFKTSPFTTCWFLAASSRC